MGIAQKAPAPDQDIEPQQEGEPARGKPPQDSVQDTVNRMIDTLSPGDVDFLAQFLRNYPGLRNDIVERAQKVCGNATVQQALALVDGTGGPPGMTPSTADDVPATPEPAPAPVEAAPALEEVAPVVGAAPDPNSQSSVVNMVDTMEPGDQVVLAKQISLHPEYRAAIIEAARSSVGDETLAMALTMVEGPPQAEQAPTPEAAADDPQNTVATTPAEPEPEKEAPWVAGARAYHAQHSEYADEFNTATAYACVDADGALDPNKVAAWQQSNGLDADGRVGPKTLKTARALHAKSQGKPPEDEAILEENLANLE